MLRRAVGRLNSLVDDVIRRTLTGAQPPLAPAMAVTEAGRVEGGPGQLGSYGIREMVDDMRMLWGVPKYRTSKPKKQTRKFAYTRLLWPIGDVVTCDGCGERHEAKTICGRCYEKVRELTNAIKRQMMQYNPYKGERPEPVEVRFTGDDQSSSADVKAEQEEADRKLGVKDGVRIVELKRPRPSWFRRDLSSEIR